MTVKMWNDISMIGFIFGSLTLIFSILLFWIDKIPRVIGELTGKTAKKAIENIQKQSETSGRMHVAQKQDNDTQLESIMNISGSLAGHTGALPENAPVAPLHTSVESVMKKPQHVKHTSHAAPAINGFKLIKDITFIQTNEIIE